MKLQLFLIHKVFQLFLVLSLHASLSWSQDFETPLCGRMNPNTRIFSDCNGSPAPGISPLISPPSYYRTPNPPFPHSSFPHLNRIEDTIKNVQDFERSSEEFDQNVQDLIEDLDQIGKQLQQEQERTRTENAEQALQREEYRRNQSALEERRLEPQQAEALRQEQSRRDSLIDRNTQIQPGDPGWDTIRDFAYRWLDLREELNVLEESEELPPYFEMSQALLDSAKGFILSADKFYIEGEIEKGDEYIQLGSIVLDQVLDPNPNFNLRDHLDIISVIPSSEWDYQFQMPEGERKLELTKVYETLFTFDPFSPLGVYAKEIGLKSAQFADKAYLEGNIEAGELGTNAAIVMTDVVLSFTPIVGWAKDIFEASVGRSIVTGQYLSSSERILAAVGILTQGYGDEIVRYSGKGFRFIENIAKDRFANLKGALRGLVGTAQELGIKSVSVLRRNAPILRRWKSTHFRQIKQRYASYLNGLADARGVEPSYLAGTKVIEFETTQVDRWVRAHGPDNQAKHWLMRREDIKGLNATQIAKKYNMPKVPTTLSEVTIPKGTKMNVGQVGPNAFGNSAGSIQYEVIMPKGKKLPDTWFAEIRPLDI